MNKESMDYQDVKHKEPIVYVLQELPGTRVGRPKFNIMGAQKYGRLKVLLREDTQINSTKTLSDEVIKLRNLEDQVKASEEHTRTLKEKARELSQGVIPEMMKEMNVTKLKLKDGASIEVTNFYTHP